MFLFPLVLFCYDKKFNLVRRRNTGRKQNRGTEILSKRTEQTKHVLLHEGDNYDNGDDDKKVRNRDTCHMDISKSCFMLLRRAQYRCTK
jgi:hypothetical protein